MGNTDIDQRIEGHALVLERRWTQPPLYVSDPTLAGANLAVGMYVFRILIVPSKAGADKDVVLRKGRPWNVL
jgi:hypothetical protein